MLGMLVLAWQVSQSRRRRRSGSVAGLQAQVGLNHKFLAAAESPPAAAEPPLTVQSPAYWQHANHRGHQ
jgi:hypothetical protein